MGPGPLGLLGMSSVTSGATNVPALVTLRERRTTVVGLSDRAGAAVELRERRLTVISLRDRLREP